MGDPLHIILHFCVNFFYRNMFFVLFYHSRDNYNYIKSHPKTVVHQFSVLCPERPPSHKEKQSDTQVQFLGLVYANTQSFSESVRC